MSRWKASGIHLLISAVIAAAVLTLMLLVWYPGPLFQAAGGNHLVLVVIGVDVTLGPLITLVIFKAGKRGLKFDLTCIAIAQLAALAYGIHAVYLARPVYLTFTLDRFDLVTAKDLDPEDLAKVTRPEFQTPPLGRPRYAAAVLPADAEEREKILSTSLVGKDLQLYPQHYAPYEQEAANALKRAAPLDKLMKLDAPAVQAFLRSSGRTADSVRYLPLRAPSHDGAVLVDAKTAQPLDILLIEAW